MMTIKGMCRQSQLVLDKPKGQAEVMQLVWEEEEKVLQKSLMPLKNCPKACDIFEFKLDSDICAKSRRNRKSCKAFDLICTWNRK